MQHLICYYKNQKRVTVIEYAVIALLFIIAAVGAIASVGEWAAIWQGLS